MCGFAGFIQIGGINKQLGYSIGYSMGKVISHRGPDDEGIWLDEESGTVLCHRRLSILDLSSSGHQPMHSSSGKYIIVFNGEVYNHLELRTMLRQRGLAPIWKGTSDTETLLALIEVFGIERTLQKLVGMFAFALWDKEERKLTLARDRMGEKPLYYGFQNGTYFFASELKCIRQHPSFRAKINHSALQKYLQHNYIPTPDTIYQDIHKLPSGHFVVLRPDSSPISYWSLEKEIMKPKIDLPNSDNDWLTFLEKLLSQSVESQMISDVPTGTFLSGGIDSSLITALMQEHSSKPIDSFSIGFEDINFNEAQFAKQVAKHIGTNHHELYVSSKEALDVIPLLPDLYDEPFADSSQIPTYLVSKFASKHVKVSLSGDGADELFGGYNRYNWGANLQSSIDKFPTPVKNLAAALFQILQPKSWDKILSPVFDRFPQRYSYQNVGEKLHKLAMVFSSSQQEDLYKLLVSNWSCSNFLLNHAEASENFFASDNKSELPLNLLNKMMYLDAKFYLSDDILVKVDRAAMGASLETRAPFLDHRVIECALKLPDHLKLNSGLGKVCLRKILYKRVPRNLIERPKMGFGVPLNSWLTGPLKGWGEELLDKTRLKNSGIFNEEAVREVWQQLQNNRSPKQNQVWNILMFEAWRENAGL